MAPKRIVISWENQRRLLNRGSANPGFKKRTEGPTELGIPGRGNNLYKCKRARLGQMHEHQVQRQKILVKFPDSHLQLLAMYQLPVSVVIPQNQQPHNTSGIRQKAFLQLTCLSGLADLVWAHLHIWESAGCWLIWGGFRTGWGTWLCSRWLIFQQANPGMSFHVTAEV